MPGTLRGRIRESAPVLAADIDALAQVWLQKLLEKIRAGGPLEFRAKQVNDPVWGTIELMPWEVALLDTPLLQRMRGVRQLGLAHLVFPGACHGRLEHIIGVVGAIEEATRALTRQIERWNRNNRDQQIRPIDDGDRYAIRLAGILHDIGHGPFSHALEPVYEINFPLGSMPPTDADWRRDLQAARGALSDCYRLNKPPSASETIAVMLVLSEALREILASDKIITERSAHTGLLDETMVAAIIGALEGPGSSFLSSVVSSQVDADKLDYLRRDAHHAGLEIGFDTDRLLAKLEVLRIREDNLNANALELRKRAAESAEGTFLQLGIAASGFGSFEQMLIGRTFLYDRLYHHHKVRAAEAMAQRLMLIAERDRGRRFSLGELFLGVDDETMLRIFAGDVYHTELRIDSPASAALARGILDRNLLHRAFAFRGRFIAMPQGIDAKSAEQGQNASWGQIVKELDGLKARYDLGVEIFELARQCALAIKAANVDSDVMQGALQMLDTIGPEQIIVDLPTSKAEGIRILARYPNGAIRVPEFSFNPQKWADAYDLQKRTGYVFCPREVAGIIGLASKIVFLANFGVSMAEEADGYIKAKATPSAWLPPLVSSEIIDAETELLLSGRRHSLISIREEDIRVPESWLVDDPDLATRLSVEVRKSLRGGLTLEHLDAFRKVMGAIFRFIDVWYSGDQLTSNVANEEEFQTELGKGLRYQGILIDEGSKVGGGKLDLWAENAVLIENKFHGSPTKPERASPAAGMQGRRYAVSLGSQVVIVMDAQKAEPGRFPGKRECVTVRPISSNDRNRVEIRFTVPFGAVVPSREVSEQDWCASSLELHLIEVLSNRLDN